MFMMRTLIRLRKDAGGLAMLEFALATPILFMAGGYGIELANYSLTQERVSSVALQLADNGSRIGVDTGASTMQLREGDLNDVLQGARLAGQPIGLTTNGRVTLSSLENIQQSYDTAPVQRIHWQRCIGLHTGYESSYGRVSPLDGSDATLAHAGLRSNGMGAAPMIQAPATLGLVFVEVNYEYHPVFGTMFMPNTKIHYEATFLVRDKRVYDRIYNPVPPSGTPPPKPSTCDKYSV